MINAVIYARFSSSAQREESIDTQIRECMMYAKKHDMVVVRTYQDKAKSGRTANRPSFQRMVRDSENGTFNAVILYTLDRFARNRFDAAYYKAKLKENGVKVYYAKQDLGDGPESILLESLMEGYAEYYSASLSRAVKAGQDENAIHCRHAGGILPYGFSLDDNQKYIVNEEEAPIVRQIFKQYAEGMSKKEICGYYNARGITHRGNKFNASFLDRFLRNERYIGIDKFSSHKTEGGVPALIDEGLWNRVQLRVKESAKVRARYKAKEIYLLTPKVYCGCCGANMYGESGTSRNGTVHTYYKCVSKKKHKKECSKRNERKEAIESRVISMIEENILTDECIAYIAKQCVKQMNRDIERDPEYASAKLRLAELDKALSNGWKAVENGYNSVAYFERLNGMEEEKKNLQKQIALLQADYVPIEEEDIVYFFVQFREKKLARLDYERFICEALIDRVVLTDTEDGTLITVICNLTDNKKSEPESGSDIPQKVDYTRQYPNTVAVFGLSCVCGGYYIPA